MLPEKNWKTEALARLFGSVVICSVFIGGLAGAMVGWLGWPPEVHEIAFLAPALGALVFFAGALFILAKPWRFETFLRQLAALVICVYGGFFLMWLAMDFHGADAELSNSTPKIAIAVLSFQGAALIFVHRFLREQGNGWADAFGLNHGRRQALCLGTVVALSMLPIGWGMQILSGLIMESFHVQPQEQQAVQVLRESVTWSSQLVLGLTAIILAPVTEEVLFRGILYPAIKQAGFPRLALWLTALLFGAIHVNVATFLPLTLLALALVWLYERTQNLLGSIMAHSLFNAANFAMVYVIQSANRLPFQK